MQIRKFCRKSNVQQLTKMSGWRMGESETCEFMALGSWWWWRGPPCPPATTDQLLKRLNLYSIFFHRSWFVHQTIWICANGSKLESLVASPILPQNVIQTFCSVEKSLFLPNSQLSHKFSPTKFEVMSKI